ncbi:MAG TPA: hypothetical protein VFR97_11200 [Capillimicrobium sp.]|nr:hypothetical protein [Capillimicrobium sp.]
MTSSIDVGGVISKIADLYQRYAAVLLPVAALVFLVEGILRFVAGDSVVLSLIVSVVAIVLTFLYMGMVVGLVADVRDGRLDQSVGQLFGTAAPVLGTLIVTAIVLGICIGVGLVLLILPGLILMSLWAAVPAAIVLEKAGFVGGVKRSMDLAKGNLFQVLGVIVILILIAIAVRFVLGLIGLAGGDGLAAVLEYVGAVLTAPLTGLASAVLYYDLRAAHGEAVEPSGASPGDAAGLGGTA